jgi:hypothetical protein
LFNAGSKYIANLIGVDSVSAMSLNLKLPNFKFELPKDLTDILSPV